MAGNKHIDIEIGRRIRRIRESRDMPASAVAQRLEMPLSSYYALEKGDYALKTTKLAAVLAVLDLEIHDLWPHTASSQLLHPELGQLARHQFRMEELVRTFRAQAAILFHRQEQQLRILLRDGLSSQEAIRVAYYLEEAVDYPNSECYVDTPLLLLVVDRKSDLPTRLIDFYLGPWREDFTADPELFRAATDSHRQP